MTPEGYQVGVPLLDDGLSAIGFKSAGCDDVPFENFAQLLCGNGCLALCDERVAFDPWLNNMEIGQPETVELPGKIVEQGLRVAVRHTVERAARPDAYRDPTTAPHGCHRFDNL